MSEGDDYIEPPRDERETRVSTLTNAGTASRGDLAAAPFQFHFNRMPSAGLDAAGVQVIRYRLRNS